MAKVIFWSRETGDGRWETGDGRRETRDERRETRDARGDDVRLDVSTREAVGRGERTASVRALFPRACGREGGTRSPVITRRG